MSVQKGWRWCKRCEVLYYANAASACSLGGAHDPSASGHYLPLTAPTTGAQDGWRWCRTCGAMFYSGLNAGRCVNGGGHDATGSGQYSIQAGSPGGYVQMGWRWCRNCQVLHYGGGACPAANGGPHASDHSGDYGLRYQIVGSGAAVAFQGKGYSGELWLRLRQNGAWLPLIRVPGGLSVTPSLVMFKGKLHIFYQGMKNCRELWLTTFDGFEFSDTMQVDDIRLEGAPSAVVRDGFLDVYIQGTDSPNHLWQNRLSTTGHWVGTNWRGSVPIWNDPATVTLTINGEQTTWVIYEPPRHVDNTNHLTLLFSTIQGWSICGTIPNTRSAGTPAVVQYEGKVYVFYEGADHNGELWYNVLTPGLSGTANPTFSGATRIPVGISGTPSPVVDGDMLCVFHEGAGNNGELWCVSTSDGHTWSADYRVADFGVSKSCGVTNFRFDP